MDHQSPQLFHPLEITTGRSSSDCGPDLEESSLWAIYQAVSLEDIEFREHLRTTADLALKLAVAVGLDRGNQQCVWFSGLLHDIGKIGIDRKILFKTDSLEASEIEEIREHTRIGHEILGRVNGRIYQAASSVALHHHERWDGRGYPDGLAGENIPRHCRIVAVADVYDCITSGRPYREARSPALAARELERSSGTQFDPTLVPVFLSKVLPNVSPG